MITHLNTVTVYVSDQQRSLDFYVDKLGFEKRADRDMGPAGRWIEVCPVGAATGLVLVRGDAFDKQDRVGSSADLVFDTDDVYAAHKTLAGWRRSQRTVAAECVLVTLIRRSPARMNRRRVMASSSAGRAVAVECL